MPKNGEKFAFKSQIKQYSDLSQGLRFQSRLLIRLIVKMQLFMALSFVRFGRQLLNSLDRDDEYGNSSLKHTSCRQLKQIIAAWRFQKMSKTSLDCLRWLLTWCFLTNFIFEARWCWEWHWLSDLQLYLPLTLINKLCGAVTVTFGDCWSIKWVLTNFVSSTESQIKFNL